MENKLNLKGENSVDNCRWMQVQYVTTEREMLRSMVDLPEGGPTIEKLKKTKYFRVRTSILILTSSGLET